MKISALTSLALQAKRAKGEKAGGDVPFGYRAVAGRLVPHETEQEVIAIARELRAEGLSFRAIGRELDARGIQNRKRTTWFPNQILRMCDGLKVTASRFSRRKMLALGQLRGGRGNQ